MGIEVDSYGNILLATSQDTDTSQGQGVICHLEIFNQNEEHIQTFSVEGIKPSGISLSGTCLYLAEILSKRIEIFTLYDKSVL